MLEVASPAGYCLTTNEAVIKAQRTGPRNDHCRKTHKNPQTEEAWKFQVFPSRSKAPPAISLAFAVRSG
jgi:hypothetical protein